jgi:GGDEF domain-containing protein
MANQPHIITHQDLKFQVIGLGHYLVDVDSTAPADALIIEANDEDYARLLVRKIRGHFNPDIYLKPVFLWRASVGTDVLLEHNHDGSLTALDQVAQLAEVVKRIALRVSHLDQQAVPSYEGQVVKKVLNYLYTRETRTLRPYIDTRSVIGYTFPEMSVNFSDKEEGQLLEILEWAEREGLIWPDFLEKVYQCNSCGSGHLHYREVCPHCDSSNSKSEDLVHHFPCAYVGPISDFRNTIDSTLTCPKCSKSLRHIGIDYDKPSVIHHCNNCDQNFQDANIKSKCLSCQNDVDVKFLVPRHINIYKLTRKGRSAATSGLFASSEAIDDVFGTVNMPTFRTIAHYEVERIKDRAELNASLAMVFVDGVLELYNRMGKKAERKLVEELVGMIRDNIRPMDIIAFETSSTFFVLLPGMDAKAAEEAMNRLATQVTEMLRRNLNEGKLKVTPRVRQLDGLRNAEAQINELSKEFSR